MSRAESDSNFFLTKAVINREWFVDNFSTLFWSLFQSNPLHGVKVRKNSFFSLVFLQVVHLCFSLLLLFVCINCVHSSWAVMIVPILISVSIKQVVSTKSTECLPFPFIFCSFVVGSLWFTYGFLIQDYFIMTPNAIGSSVSAFQLILFLIYPSKRVPVKVSWDFKLRFSQVSIKYSILSSATQLLSFLFYYLFFFIYRFNKFTFFLIHWLFLLIN